MFFLIRAFLLVCIVGATGFFVADGALRESSPFHWAVYVAILVMGITCALSVGGAGASSQLFSLSPFKTGLPVAAALLIFGSWQGGDLSYQGEYTSRFESDVRIPEKERTFEIAMTTAPELHQPAIDPPASGYSLVGRASTAASQAPQPVQSVGPAPAGGTPVARLHTSSTRKLTDQFSLEGECQLDRANRRWCRGYYFHNASGGLDEIKAQVAKQPIARLDPWPDDACPNRPGRFGNPRPIEASNFSRGEIECGQVTLKGSNQPVLACRQWYSYECNLGGRPIPGQYAAADNELPQASAEQPEQLN